ncbi:hypothetical protein [Deinococcus hopiensis]|uniref:Uncharacterized protein n=1 Tax=Deinococcus hopiensis KR-140 TaxID=695939 RepID=A0A1W1V5L3_9DEIO|nr:hypothetical protein [Deinococcus hopiensis]SMB88593.1 hypothetical protein SAMN00790413_00111 [Deinococcus hopiensis KR-140]
MLRPPMEADVPALLAITATTPEEWAVWRLRPPRPGPFRRRLEVRHGERSPALSVPLPGAEIFALQPSEDGQITPRQGKCGGVGARPGAAGRVFQILPVRAQPAADTQVVLPGPVLLDPRDDR